MIRSGTDIEHLLAKAAEASSEGRPDAARRFVRRAVSLQPDHAGAQLHWAIELLDHPELARHHLRRAAQLGEGDPVLEYQVAWVLLELGDVEPALTTARRAQRHLDDGDVDDVTGLVLALLALKTRLRAARGA